jgi:large subunit ribosomal protein L30
MKTELDNGLDRKMLEIRLTKGLVGKKATQRKVVSALGLGKWGSSVVLSDSPAVRGMVNKISHLLTVNELAHTPASRVKAKTKPQSKTKAAR